VRGKHCRTKLGRRRQLARAAIRDRQTRIHKANPIPPRCSGFYGESNTRSKPGWARMSFRASGSCRHRRTEHQKRENSVLIQWERRSSQSAGRCFGYAGSPEPTKRFFCGRAFVSGHSSQLSKYSSDNLSLIYPVINGLNRVGRSTSYIRPEREAKVANSYINNATGGSFEPMSVSDRPTVSHILTMG
jgi:hypothetical protein